MDAEAEERLSYCPPAAEQGKGKGGRGGREGDWCPPAELGEADGVCVCVMSSLLPCVHRTGSRMAWQASCCMNGGGRAPAFFMDFSLSRFPGC